MSYIEDLTINISLQTKAISEQDFGTALIIGKRASGDSRIGKLGTYDSTDAMKDDGFVDEDPEFKIASEMFKQNPSPPRVMTYTRDDSGTISEGLDEAKSIDNSFYGILIEERDKASLHAAGDWASINEKIFIGSSADLTVLDDRNNLRESFLVHKQAVEFPEAGWVGMNLHKQPGSITWKWKSPVGAIASDYSFAELSQIRSGHGQTLSKRAGVVYSDEGVTTSGEYIDVIQSRDFVKARLSEALFALMVKTDKIPYDNTGFAKIEDAIRTVLREAGDLGIIAKVVTEEDQAKSDEGTYKFIVSVPNLNDISTNNRALRKIPGISFSFVIAGAIHALTINGVITV